MKRGLRGRLGNAGWRMALLILGSGPDLLAEVKALGGASPSELVRDCGSVSTKTEHSSG